METRINIIDGSIVNGVRLDTDAVEAEQNLKKLFTRKVPNQVKKAISIFDKTIKPTTVATTEDYEKYLAGEEVETITAFASNISENCTEEEQQYIDYVITTTKAFYDMVETIPADMFNITSRL